MVQSTIKVKILDPIVCRPQHSLDLPLYKQPIKQGWKIGPDFPLFVSAFPTSEEFHNSNNS